MAASPKSLLFISLLLLSSNLSHSFFLLNYFSLVSLSHSLISRVASVRSARGDTEGAARNFEAGGLRLYKYAWKVGRDFMKNYAWSDVVRDLGGVASDLKELLRVLGELIRVRSEPETVAWAGRIYEKALTVSKSLFARLLKIFSRSGPMQDFVVSLQEEVLEGDLLRDCLELGAGDLKSLMQIIKGIASMFFPTAPKDEL
ncbi:uncharacterized protein LOC125195403 [Salvia hispanica]|uniref:uncharacterized protein LOC125195403 n=1 Tax=Salvia hispanica TaxID=49212 RepID=UPI002008F720|nr:uncharacterized protein LOC125195403 [Salvia hispanica]